MATEQLLPPMVTLVLSPEQGACQLEDNHKWKQWFHHFRPDNVNRSTCTKLLGSYTVHNRENTYGGCCSYCLWWRRPWRSRSWRCWRHGGGWMWCWRSGCRGGCQGWILCGSRPGGGCWPGGGSWTNRGCCWLRSCSCVAGATTSAAQSCCRVIWTRRSHASSTVVAILTSWNKICSITILHMQVTFKLSFHHFILSIAVKLWAIYKSPELSIMTAWVPYTWNIWYVGGCTWSAAFPLVKRLITISRETGYKRRTVHAITDDSRGIPEHTAVGNWSCAGVSHTLASDTPLHRITK